MATSTGNQLAQSIRRKIEELKKVCEGLDESTASVRLLDDGLRLCVIEGGILSRLT